MILVVAMRRRPDEGGITCIHVEDAPLAPTAQREETASVDDDFLGRVVHDLCGLFKHDGVGLGAAIEVDDATLGDGAHDHLARTALGRATTDDLRRIA